MAQKELSQEESLQVIQGMIALAKNKINETGFHFLLWGSLVIVACLAQYFMIVSGMPEDSNLVWIAMPLIGLPTAFIFESRRNSKPKTQSKFDKMYGYLWLGFGITLFITIYLAIANNTNPIPFILSLVGLATFVSGAIYGFTPLVVGAFTFWIAAFVCMQLDTLNQLLVNAAATFIGYIIPGILLWKKFKATRNV